MILTDRTIEGLRAKNGVRTVTDPKTRGLTLRVGTRTKVWYLAYTRAGKQQWLKLGEFPTLRLKDARERVEAERGRLADGVDPVAERQRETEPAPLVPPAFTFAD